MNQITVNNIDIDVVRKNIKNLHLAVYPPNGRVRIATPLRLDDEAIRLFAISKMSWIKKQISKFDSQERQLFREYVSGENHYFEGHRYLLNVIYQKGTPRVIIRNKTYLDLYVKPNSTRDQRERVLTKWYRQELKSKIPALIEKWQEIIGVEINDWEVKKMKTKWGTCKIESRRIWLNLELAKKTSHCLEYIIVHELVHLLERHHNDRFTSLMNKFLPTWRFSQKELNQFVLSHEHWSY
ncbi:MAG TPA: SprT family zinc-dependent metalloprotease [Pyrinomonadaceae bacterium]|nr:SprT family zinc-dependent metalloprotease [Pyrinomonadaceae bacterium]